MHTRGRRIRALGAAVLIVAALMSPMAAQGGQPQAGDLRADLDGKPIPLVQVGNHYCDDFSYPLIHCFSSARDLAARTLAIEAVTAVTYVTIYEFTTYAGSFMQVSADYTVLATIGWNDRISSFKGRNSQSGHFFTDWFYGAVAYGFCCNQTVASLGSYDNTFSSVHRL